MKLVPVRISVTEDDIATADYLRHDSTEDYDPNYVPVHNCPIAQAIVRQINVNLVKVAMPDIECTDKSGQKFALKFIHADEEQSAAEFQHSFDRIEPVTPFDMTLMAPAPVVPGEAAENMTA